MAYVRQQWLVLGEKALGLGPESRQAGIGEWRIGDVGFTFDAKHTLRYEAVEPPPHKAPICASDASPAKDLIEPVPLPRVREEAGS